MRFGIQPYSMVFLLALACESTMAQSVDYSVVSVPEESGTDFTQISQTTDYVCMPESNKATEASVGSPTASWIFPQTEAKLPICLSATTRPISSLKI